MHDLHLKPTHTQDSAVQKSFYLSRKKYLHILFAAALLLDSVFVPSLAFRVFFFFGLLLSRGVISAEDSTVTMTQTSLTL